MWFRSIAYRLRQVHQQLGFVAPLTKEDCKEVARVLPSPAAFSLFRAMSPADQQHALRVCRGLQARGCTNEDMLAAALLHDVGKAQGRVPFWTRPAIVLGKKLAPQLLSRLVLYPNGIEHLQPVGAGDGMCGEGTLASPPSKEQELALPYPGAIAPSIVGAMPCARPSAPYARPSTPYARPARPAMPCARPSTPCAHPTSIPKWLQSLSNAWYHAEIGADLASAAGLSGRAVLYIRTHHQPGGPAAELHAVDEVS